MLCESRHRWWIVLLSTRSGSQQKWHCVRRLLAAVICVVFSCYARSSHKGEGADQKWQKGSSRREAFQSRDGPPYVGMIFSKPGFMAAILGQEMWFGPISTLYPITNTTDICLLLNDSGWQAQIEQYPPCMMAYKKGYRLEWFLDKMPL